VEARFSAPVQTGSGAHAASCKTGTGSFLRVKSGRGVTLTAHPHLVPRSWKSTAIPLLPLWAVRHVESLSARTKVHFTFTFTFITEEYLQLRTKPTSAHCCYIFYYILLSTHIFHMTPWWWQQKWSKHVHEQQYRIKWTLLVCFSLYVCYIRI